MNGKLADYEKGMVQELVDSCGISRELAARVVSKAIKSGVMSGQDQILKESDDLKEIEWELKEILSHGKTTDFGDVLCQEFDWSLPPKILAEWEAIKQDERDEFIEEFATQIAKDFDRDATIKYLENLIEAKKKEDEEEDDDTEN